MVSNRLIEPEARVQFSPTGMEPVIPAHQPDNALY